MSNPSTIDQRSHEPPGTVLPYETRLAQDSRWALTEGSRYFDQNSAAHVALRKIAARLEELGISYAVVGGMALFAHGYLRFTDDVDILVTRQGLNEIHQQLEGLGYVPPFTGSKNLRDAESGVKIEFLITGDYPGDGKPKPVAFPDPLAVRIEKDGIHYVNLLTVIELKIASASADRIRDLGDVQELIKILGLPETFAEQMNPYVREKFRDLWQAAQPASKRYVRILKSSSSQELIAAMLKDGILVDPDRGTSADTYLVTSDPVLARKYDMHDEGEFLRPVDPS